jgi:hypothetical protein
MTCTVPKLYQRKGHSALHVIGRDADH